MNTRFRLGIALVALLTGSAAAYADSPVLSCGSAISSAPLLYVDLGASNSTSADTGTPANASATLTVRLAPTQYGKFLTHLAKGKVFDSCDISDTDGTLVRVKQAAITSVHYVFNPGLVGNSGDTAQYSHPYVEVSFSVATTAYTDSVGTSDPGSWSRVKNTTDLP